MMHELYIVILDYAIRLIGMYRKQALFFVFCSRHTSKVLIMPSIFIASKVQQETTVGYVFFFVSSANLKFT